MVMVLEVGVEELKFRNGKSGGEEVAKAKASKEESNHNPTLMADAVMQSRGRDFWREELVKKRKRKGVMAWARQEAQSHAPVISPSSFKQCRYIHTAE